MATRLWRRYTRRVDSEHEQALIRIVLGTLMVLGVLLSAPRTSVVWATCTAGIVIPLGIALWILADPRKSPVRRIISNVADQYFITAAIILGAPTGSWFVGVYLWVIVGNGIRYGTAYMMVSAVLGSMGFIYVMYTVDGWINNRDAGIGILIGMVMVPAYLSTLLARLENAQKRLQALAYHDALTDIANRRLIGERLMQAMALSQRLDKNCAVLLFDLDGFKVVNDTHGHEIGDALLKCVADTLKPKFRAYDTFGRFGGDEFVVVLENVNVPNDSLRLARVILSTIESIKEVNACHVEISASIGVTAYPVCGPGESSEGILKRADDAMYKAKKEGKRGFAFDPDLPGAADMPRR